MSVFARGSAKGAAPRRLQPRGRADSLAFEDSHHPACRYPLTSNRITIAAELKIAPKSGSDAVKVVADAIAQLEALDYDLRTRSSRRVAGRLPPTTSSTG